MDRAFHHGYMKFQSQRVQDTKKVGCSAKVVVREIMNYPDFKNVLTSKEKQTVARQVRANLDAGTKGILLSMPSIEDHSFHVTGKAAGLVQVLDPSLVSRIKELVEEGMVDVDDLKAELKEFVRDNISAALHQNNRRYFPTRMTIANHIRLAEKAMGWSEDDQEQVQQLVILIVKQLVILIVILNVLPGPFPTQGKSATVYILLLCIHMVKNTCTYKMEITSYFQHLP
ncbi:hypothetical protein DPMN_124497 [Dreissena polymorpha]|uniref:Uncharacterized protein n=1 Tax=Dreissena polymorpha TaxID=45954 RepID=A0A9D4GZL0_DREPO|nr:hypothetical protein DPMN_124497 [Dreissena polymorpha]